MVEPITQSPQRYLPRYWLVRLYLSLSVLVVATIACFEVQTMIYQIIRASGPAGWWCVMGLGFIALLGVLDVFINDLAPDDLQLHCTKRHRHLIYMAMALGLASTAYVVIKSVGVNAFLARLLLDATIATAVAYLDLFARHRP